MHQWVDWKKKLIWNELNKWNFVRNTNNVFNIMKKLTLLFQKRSSSWKRYVVDDLKLIMMCLTESFAWIGWGLCCRVCYQAIRFCSYVFLVTFTFSCNIVSSQVKPKQKFAHVTGWWDLAIIFCPYLEVQLPRVSRKIAVLEVISSIRKFLYQTLEKYLWRSSFLVRLRVYRVFF